MEQLRIVSYNVRYFGHFLRGLASTRGPKRSIAASLVAMDPLPDVICLQEVETRSLRSNIAHRDPDANRTQLEAFMVRMDEATEAAGIENPFEAFYFRAHTYQLRNTPLYTTGLALIVNTRRVKVDTHNSAHPHDITCHHVERLRDRKQSRICAHARIFGPDGQPLHVFNTHLSLPTPFDKGFWQSKQRMGYGPNQLQEAETLACFVREHAGDEPYVVCGDFNSAPGSPVYRYLTEEVGLVGAQERLGLIDPSQPRAFPTAGFMHLRMHLDHIFSSGQVRWSDMKGTRPFGDRQAAFHGFSDHMPLIARFQV